ncbi:MAG: hypothetical protein F8N37_00805 [Telmatospirillum sp.]|nr:hypothetical protein [Telmatospirillum sp.]
MIPDREKSDPSIVAMKPANKDGQPFAELVEPRGGAEGNARQPSTLRTPSREGVTAGLERIRTAARLKKKERFTALLHHVTVDLLRSAYSWLKRDAAAGVDGVTWEDYGVDLERRLADLHGRVHRGSYRTQPTQRQYIPKPDGRQRPLGIAAIEDKIVQRALAEVLNAIYEENFLGFSYGFRPGRSQEPKGVGVVCVPAHQRLSAENHSDPFAFAPAIYAGWARRLRWLWNSEKYGVICVPAHQRLHVENHSDPIFRSLHPIVERSFFVGPRLSPQPPEAIA